MTDASWSEWAAAHRTLLLGSTFLFVLALYIMRSWQQSSEEPLDLSKVGNICPEELLKYAGFDPFRATLLSVRGVIFDVTSGRDFYGPKGTYAVFAGRECARGLGKMSKDEADCTGDLAGLTDAQMETLCDWEVKFRQKYPVVGSLVKPKLLTLKELRQHDGNSPELPMLLAIKGTIFDISTGKDFYGPDGMYPFAGHECARAFALVSTDTKDCHDNLEGLNRMELESLKDWEARFYSKYPIVGSVVQ